MSSKLLLDEYPLQVLPRLAVAIGLNEAISLQHLHSRIESVKIQSQANLEIRGNHFRDERWWIYSSIPEWQIASFPFWSKDTIKRTFSALKNPYESRGENDPKIHRDGLVTTTNRYGNRFDNTLWYTINYECFAAVKKLINIQQSDFLDIIADALPEISSMAELKVVLHVLLRTLKTGNSERITLREFMKGTGLSRNSVKAGARSAIQHSLLIKERENNIDAGRISHIYRPLVNDFQGQIGSSARLQDVSGYVYLLQAGPYYKIGASQTVDKRIKQLSTIPPFEIELICAIKTNTMYELERELHERFSDKQVRGEWFTLNDEDIVYIENLTGSNVEEQ
ncbi:MAG: GIY-YIG nuclease family protein [Chloroflexi bacterium]|nr:GIY-YIG nuclease family protein [Chloroflexota bacterium]